MTGRSRRLTGAVLATAVLAVAGGCGSSGGSGQTATPVALRADADAPVPVGVVVSLTSDPGQGEDWSGSAEGAQVAAYRFGLGDLQVKLLPENDRGTAQGARDAVRHLLAQHVAGIVLATSGDHVSGALGDASKAGVPVLLPYAAPTGSLPAGVWSTGPDGDQVGTAISERLTSQSLHSPVLVDAGGGAVAHLSPVDTISYAAGDDADAVAAKVTRETRQKVADSVVVSGPADLQGQVLAALQGRHSAVPVLLTPQAISPGLSTSLSAAGGALDAQVSTVGIRGGDATTLQSGAGGRAASAYYAALRAAAESPKLQDFFDGRPFDKVAADSDSRAHDAVVAIVAAAAKAGANDPTEVRKALAGMTVTDAQGLAGPDLDFRHASAVRDSDVLTLSATAQDPGVLPTGAPRIHWFVAPTD